MFTREGVLPHLLARRAIETPDASAMRDVDGRELTYAEAHSEMLRWSDAYRGLGVAAGDTVVTMFPNSFDAYFAWLGLAWLRAIEVPLNNMYRGQMLEYLLSNSDAGIAVISERFIDRVAACAPDIAGLHTIVVPDLSESQILSALPVQVIDGPTFFERATPGAEAGPEVWDIAAMIYTSGTTGPSKGVLVPWAQLFELVNFLPEDFLEPNRGLYTTYPAFHLAGKGMVYASAYFEGCLVVRETFSVGSFVDDVVAHDCMTAALVGPMAAMLMASPAQPADEDTPLRNVAMGPLIPQLEEFRQRFGVRVCTGFGMTEVGAPIASGWQIDDIRSCGRRRPGYPGYEVRVVDDHDFEVPHDTVGELIVRADSPWVLSRRYWKLPEATAEAWRNGWFHTGDAFMEDDLGNFTFVDRIKDAIRRRGENISSFEVEALVLQHPAVAECAAVAVPSELGEDDVKVCVVLGPDEAVTPEELVTWLVPRMPSFMVPRYVEYVDSLPRTDATQRIRKTELRQNPLNDSTWDRDAAGIVVPH